MFLDLSCIYDQGMVLRSVSIHARLAHSFTKTQIPQVSYAEMRAIGMTVTNMTAYFKASGCFGNLKASANAMNALPATGCRGSS